MAKGCSSGKVLADHCKGLKNLLDISHHTEPPCTT